MKPLSKIPRRKWRRRSRRPTLRFTPYAWAKLLYLRDCGPTEIGGFGISAPDDLLLVEDIALIPQRCSPVTVAFDDHGLADFFDRQVDQGMQPEQFARLWIHTHPGNSPMPSSTDEATFGRVFGRNDWAVIFILAQEGATYARLHFQAGPGGDVPMKVAVDFQAPFPSSDVLAWEFEYTANLLNLVPDQPTQDSTAARPTWFDDSWPYRDDWHDFESLPKRLLESEVTP